ncbi:MAG: transcription antitermination factor NusB [Magnetococcales bacterium]|nr:transcription antitermination factor NusB [Magnetococcales bacterium]
MISGQPNPSPPETPASPPRRLGGSRHKARELALQALYQSEISGDAIQRAVDQLCEENAGGQADLLYFQTVAAGTWNRRAELDEWIAKAAINWSIQRISTIDLNILRQGVYELLAEPELPIGVVINEAIELSKRYGGNDSRLFVNGVMDRLASQIRPIHGEPVRVPPPRGEADAHPPGTTP